MPGWSFSRTFGVGVARHTELLGELEDVDLVGAGAVELLVEEAVEPPRHGRLEGVEAPQVEVLEVALADAAPQLRAPDDVARHPLALGEVAVPLPVGQPVALDEVKAVEALHEFVLRVVPEGALGDDAHPQQPLQGAFHALVVAAVGGLAHDAQQPVDAKGHAGLREAVAAGDGHQGDVDALVELGGQP